jgi:glyoxylate reductase
MKKVYVTRDVLDDGINLLKDKGFEVQVWAENRPMTPLELHTAAQKVDALWCTMADLINKKFLMENKHLKIITNYAVGTNNIDKETASELGIIIGNTPDVLTEATAETAFGLMICASRNFRAAMKNAENGEWSHFQPKGFLGPQLKGKTVGIVGNGRIGSRMGEMCAGAFGMKVKGYKRGEDLVEFVRDLDVLSLHIPLTPETKHIIGKKEIAAMKSSAIIVNTARGDVIDQDALYEALRDKKIFSAGLDVTSPEPLVPTHPLYSLPNVMILPHIGSATFESRTEMSLLCAKNILAAFLK